MGTADDEFSHPVAADVDDDDVVVVADDDDDEVVEYCGNVKNSSNGGDDSNSFSDFSFFSLCAPSNCRRCSSSFTKFIAPPIIDA